MQGLGSRTGNQIRTALLLALVAGFLMATGAIFGQTAFVLSIVLAAGVCAYLYVSGPSLPLRAMHARSVSELQQPALFRMIRELSTSARLPMPAIYVSPTAAPTAFATGHGPTHSAVCVTIGLLELLSEDELRAVLAHQLARIGSRDTLTASVAGALGAVICGFAGFGYLLGFGDGGARRSRVVDAMLSVLAPIAGALIRLGVSRTVDYRADHTGALLTGSPSALVSALEKASDGAARAPLPPEPEIAVHANTMLVCPFLDSDRMGRIFRTQPPVERRVERLQALTS
ncbi:Protease HtpX homolog (plasmid) [Tsukamurella tyrosinosolvens]|uniref:Heat shock protein. Metallo peptidase. MEROPS family M48B n=1 Tax=Tsukamurella tyrosinosolvens TaxID=57704 RepID=A0A1H4MUV8_TSUTY|nr:M48 family metalloprotease [Tsukamurella tyrosinosolvens]WEL93899.1 M48 family metalloprotease [Tsukamurella tyrosinosolvens]SEB86809.1 Heat shock protein. Metallo peptidase. MEROPS family M48B [Tsukamurella tyrosinosolvens]VEI00595.1 Protease HtpX homolog [Tsukamurella tyrosinosolvens]